MNFGNIFGTHNLSQRLELEEEFAMSAIMQRKTATAKLSKAAAILAFAIGAMAIFSGGQVLLGQMPDYYVINWLPLYNYTLGIVTLVFTAVVIWQNHKLALAAVIATLSSHSLVFIILQTAYHDQVAPDSIRAMTLRIVVWAIILVLMLNRSRQQTTTHG
jgi:hypothetical protein